MGIFERLPRNIHSSWPHSHVGTNGRHVGMRADVACTHCWCCHHGDARTELGQENDGTYNGVQTLCMFGFFCVPGTWLLSMVALCLARPKTTSSRGSLAIFIQAGHIAMWALMDATWACGLMWPALTAGVATMVMLALNLEPDEGGGLTCSGADRADIAWIMWTASNVVWVLCELGCDDSLPVRYVAGVLGLLSLLVLLASYHHVRDQERCRATQLFGADPLPIRLCGS